jgi:hypothetical protein
MPVPPLGAAQAVPVVPHANGANAGSGSGSSSGSGEARASGGVDVASLLCWLIILVSLVKLVCDGHLDVRPYPCARLVASRRVASVRHDTHL